MNVRNFVIKICSKRALYGALILLIVITCAVTIRRTAKGSNDFDTFYAAGRAVLSGRGIYYTGDFYQNAGGLSPFLYPPFAACFFALWAFLPKLLAAACWNIFSILLFLLGIRLMHQRWLKASLPRSPNEWTSPQWRAFFLCAVMGLVLLMDNLTMAQMNITVFFVTLASFLLWRKGCHVWSGIVLSAAMMLKVVPALFIFFYAVKRQWRVLWGCFAGLVIFGLVVTALVFGLDKTRLYYRQWLGRTVKPMVIQFYSEVPKKMRHPLQKSVAEIKYSRLADLLNKQNQSLPAVLSRLFLKDRNQYARDTAFPIYAARKYEKMPVLFGGLPYGALQLAIRLVQALLLLLMLSGISRASDGSVSGRIAWEWCFVFLSIPFFSPFFRSHQFVFLMAPYLLTLRDTRFFRYFLIVLLVYCMQMLPYGKAAGFGLWANMLLWLHVFLRLSKKGELA
ncbi:MAG: hypothetical protein A2Z83_05970 [Omnitrophica bacterium GWA2_52_8]|nr:MAG: hypothetical protein A2Z83_05970 [Omnitrophica bacterium GWA2_52_8]